MKICKYCAEESYSSEGRKSDRIGEKESITMPGSMQTHE